MISLLRSRQFGPLFLCQFFSMLNSHCVLYILIYVIITRAPMQQSAMLATLATGAFLAPAVVLSGSAGQIADKYSRQRLAQLLKSIELAIQLIVLVGVATANIILLFVCVIALGAMATLFSPVKYGLLTDHLKITQLSAANSLLTSGTFLAILLGTILAGLVVRSLDSLFPALAALAVVAIASWSASRLIPTAVAACSGLSVDANMLRSTVHSLTVLGSNRQIWIVALTLSWFWLNSSLIMALVPSLVVQKGVVDGLPLINEAMVLITVGVALGSILTGIISGARVVSLLVPISAALIALFLADMAFIAIGSPLSSAGDFRQHLLFDVFFLSLACGMFPVPLMALLQKLSGQATKGQVNAAANGIKAIIVVIGTAFFGAMQTTPVYLSAAEVALVMATLNLVIGGAFFATMRFSALNDIFYLIFRALFRLEVKGLENIDQIRGGYIIAPNHPSRADSVLVASVLDFRPGIAGDPDMPWWASPITRLYRIYMVNPMRPLAVPVAMRGLRDELGAGNPIVVFPEGRVTRTGGVMKIYHGISALAEQACVPLVPAYISGMEHTPLARVSATGLARKSLFPKVTITLCAPRMLAIDTGLPLSAKRNAASATILDFLTEAKITAQNANGNKSLADHLESSLVANGLARKVLGDTEGCTYTGKSLLAEVNCTAEALRRYFPPGSVAGLVAANSVQTVVTLLAMSRAEITPVLLPVANVDEKDLCALLASVGLAQAIVPTPPDTKQTNNEWIDLKVQSNGRRTVAVYAPFDLVASKRWSATRGAALVTLQSTEIGEEQLGQHEFHVGNLIANLAQIFARFPVTMRDRFFTAAPMHDAFGLLFGVLYPLVCGAAVTLHVRRPNSNQLGELVYRSDATVLVGNKIFYDDCVQFAHDFDVHLVRKVVMDQSCGLATGAAFADKFGLCPVSAQTALGDGLVISLSRPTRHEASSVARLLPGFRSQKHESGRLLIAGQSLPGGPEIWHELPEGCDILLPITPGETRPTTSRSGRS
jgi:acyl-[acyl-carrier-protein]-phospholipid O-acyltransferase/long-chain-fatty-acid--[acyl-carrier-protein] ligase